jgi:hypothetical protein
MIPRYDLRGAWPRRVAPSDPEDSPDLHRLSTGGRLSNCLLAVREFRRRASTNQNPKKAILPVRLRSKDKLRRPYNPMSVTRQIGS